MPATPARRFPVVLVAIALAALFAIPGFRSSYFGDDYVMIGVLRGAPAIASKWDLYRFVGGNPGELARMIQQGPFMWWTHPDAKVAFFRPLASALFAFDHWLFGLNPLPYVIHSFVWFALLLAVLHRVLRRFVSENTARLALILFAIDDAHWMPMAWSSSRHATVASVFGLLGLLAHVRHREEGWRPGLFLAPLAFVVALLAGENGLGLMAFVFAYEAWHRRSEPRATRMRALVPTLAVLAIYFPIYRALGYGVRFSQAYIDPISTPVRFLVAAAWRVPVLLCDVFVGVPADLTSAYPIARYVVVAGILGSIAIVFLLRRILRDHPEDTGIVTLAIGALLAIFPAVGALPGSRLALVPSMGSCVAIAIVLRFGWRAAQSTLGKIGLRAAVLYAAFAHCFVAPLALAGTLETIRKVAQTTESIAEAAEVGVSGARVIVLRGSDPTTSIYPLAVRWVRAGYRPDVWWILSMAQGKELVTRTSDRSIELELLDETVFDSTFAGVFRARDTHMAVGDRVPLLGGEVRVLAVKNGGPTRFSLTVDRSLDDPVFRIVSWRDGALRTFVLPKLGETVDVPWAVGPMGL